MVSRFALYLPLIVGQLLLTIGPAQASDLYAQVPETPSREQLEAPPVLPPAEQILEPPQPEETPTPKIPLTVYVERFRVEELEGSPFFDADVLAEVAKRGACPIPSGVDATDICRISEEDFAPDGSNVLIQQELSFTQLIQARSAVTEYYVNRGYLTTGALLPPQDPQNGEVVIRVVEGKLEDIDVDVQGRLRSRYVRRRLEVAASDPLNVDDLLDGLQLLQLDPLIDNISAELATGVEPGTSTLNVEVDQADSFDLDLLLNNGRSPSVGSFRRQAQLTEANLFGLGDRLSLGYSNTDGSDTVDVGYTLPLNPRNGTLSFSYGTTDSEVIEEPFNFLDIQSDSRFYELTYRQPVVQTPTQEFALSITASRRESESEFLESILGEAIPFDSLGADDEGRTRISALRLTQEWSQRGTRQVIAARSQFSVGLDAFDATINEGDEPDSRFFAWRGQAQWVRLIGAGRNAPTLVLRGDLQLADGSLVPLERFGLGGARTVRGYRQDELLTDNGVLGSAEIRLPVARARAVNGVLQVAPFFDVGRGWDLDAVDPEDNTLAALGLGLLWQMDRFTARLDVGFPLIETDTPGDSLQEDGIYFSVIATPF